jgi:restriction system protein
MAAVVPSFDKLMWPVLRALKAMGGSGTNQELLQKVIEIERIPEEVQNVIHTDHRQTRLNYNLAWAKTYLRMTNALENSSRGVWALTKYGETLTEQDVRKIPAQVRAMHPAKKKPGRRGLKGEAERADLGRTPEQWKDQLLDVLCNMKPDAFERLSQRVLRESGFTKVEITGRSGDGGIDGVGVLRIGLVSFPVTFQCKRYQRSVSSSVVRDFRGAMVGRSDKGIIITTGTFTSDAQKEATRDGAPAIDLIDGERLCEILKDTKLGVSTEHVEKVSVNPDWFASV